MENNPTHSTPTTPAEPSATDTSAKEKTSAGLQDSVAQKKSAESHVVEGAEQDITVVAASKRSAVGKSPARAVRRSGLIPGNILLKERSLPITLEPKWLAKIWKQEGGVFILDLEGERSKVKIHEVQIDPVKRVPLHVDLKHL